MPNAMNRRQFLYCTATLGASFALSEIPFPLAEAFGRQNVDRSLLKGLRIVDAHAHPEQFHTDNPRIKDLSSTLESITELGMTASVFSAVGDLSEISSRNPQEDDYGSTHTQLNRVLRMSKVGKVRLILKSADLPDVVGPGNPPGAILAIEGGNALGGKPERIDEFHKIGVRLITLMHYSQNELGDVMLVWGEKRPASARNGLTAKGRKVVERMQELGMVVDVAHAHSLTLKHVVEIGNKPLVDSHTSPCPLPDPPGCTRPRKWEDMEHIAKTGGVVCTWPLAYEAGGTTRRSFSDWAREILDMKKKLGIEHVGLGTDGGGNLPSMINGYRDVRDLVSLVAAMREVGLYAIQNTLVD